VQLPELTVASVELKITVSVGVAARQLKESRDGLIERLAPLKAKRAGKNRVALAR
jgi:PleD family two-component response regulator